MLNSYVWFCSYARKHTNKFTLNIRTTFTFNNKNNNNKKPNSFSLSYNCTNCLISSNLAFNVYKLFAKWRNLGWNQQLNGKSNKRTKLLIVKHYYFEFQTLEHNQANSNNLEERVIILIDSDESNLSISLTDLEAKVVD